LYFDCGDFILLNSGRLVGRPFSFAE